MVEFKTFLYNKVKSQPEGNTQYLGYNPHCRSGEAADFPYLLFTYLLQL